MGPFRLLSAKQYSGLRGAIEGRAEEREYVGGAIEDLPCHCDGVV
jgi:hypothetical protein